MSILPKQFYYKNNRLQQLRGFYYAVQFKSLSKAAEHMSINQSAVTMQIQSLERDLNITLLDRNGPNFSMTKAGEQFFALSLPHIEGINSICERFYAEYEAEGLKKLDIAANHISILHLLPGYIKEYKDLYPEVHISLRNLSLKEALDRLIKDEIHLVVYPVNQLPEGFEFTPIRTYKTVLVVPKNHPLTKKKNLTLHDVKEYELIRIDPHLITVPLFEENIKQYGLKTNMTLENGDWEILKHLVRAGAGVAILSSICLTEADDTLVGISLEQYFPSINYGIITKKGNIPLPQVQYFTELLLRGDEVVDFQREKVTA
jgi:DNA-binding transcriptional LysR family regulator